MTEERNLIRPYGGYRKLRSFQCAQQVYDAAVVFCDRFMNKRSRTEDFLRQRDLRVWEKCSPEALAVRRQCLSDMSDASDKSDFSSLAAASAEVAANTLICMANQASYLLGRQLRALEQRFLADGGFTERLYRERKRQRGRW